MAKNESILQNCKPAIFVVFGRKVVKSISIKRDNSKIRRQNLINKKHTRLVAIIP